MLLSIEKTSRENEIKLWACMLWAFPNFHHQMGIVHLQARQTKVAKQGVWRIVHLRSSTGSTEAQIGL